MLARRDGSDFMCALAALTGIDEAIISPCADLRALPLLLLTSP
jgi:hypothetical protein